MYVLGLTGGMAAGKSTIAALFRRAKVPVFDADACVRRLQAPHGRAIGPLQRAFPAVVHNGQLDRVALRRLIGQDAAVLPRLEQIIHPLVKQERRAFLARCRARGVPFCVLDIPLLWETGAERDCTAVMVVEAPLAVRIARLRQRHQHRGQMSVEEAKAFLTRQMTDQERRQRADIVIKTGLSRAFSARQIHRFLQQLRQERDEASAQEGKI
ncbi:dephospho-CoA kinase [Bombella saccharophila]|uniref:Dephospho-CoA kinase n=1 Tax=Bombella saccharophila TaxID=2967338 RepID=A0ABT3W5C5_9PROT|nr:dephospho-CoA kinase [Bombella saccharophila]MCX5614247.1 dephospho-CoA kinase [Bombella saccharophila]